jgi:c-di-GMP-binding flagellar brake protein YcgR
MKEKRVYVRDMRERRKYVRFRIDQMVEMRFGQERFLRVEGVDLSEQGIRCISADGVEPYSKVFVSFRLDCGDEEREIQGEGIVVRSEKAGDEYSIAVQFSDLSDAERDAIQAFAAAVVTRSGQQGDSPAEKENT